MILNGFKSSLNYSKLANTLKTKKPQQLVLLYRPSANPFKKLNNKLMKIDCEALPQALFGVSKCQNVLFTTNTNNRCKLDVWEAVYCALGTECWPSKSAKTTKGSKTYVVKVYVRIKLPMSRYSKTS